MLVDLLDTTLVPAARVVVRTVEEEGMVDFGWKFTQRDCLQEGLAHPARRLLDLRVPGYAAFAVDLLAGLAHYWVAGHEVADRADEVLVDFAAE